MKLYKRLPLLGVLAAACSTQAPATDLVASPLAGGVWQVVSIDGRPVEPPPSDDDARLPQFTFGSRTYGGNAGCNAMGGYYAQVGERLYTMPGPSTAMACPGARMTQEMSAGALFAASPTVTRDAGAVTLAGGGHRMALRRIGDAGNVDDPTAWQGPTVAGQTYVIHEVNGVRTDGRVLSSNAAPELSFGDTQVTMKLDCPGSVSGRFNLGTEHVLVSGLGPACSAPGARDAALITILTDGPRTVSGPNGELLLASRSGWAILWNERRDRPK